MSAPPAAPSRPAFLFGVPPSAEGTEAFSGRARDFRFDFSVPVPPAADSDRDGAHPGDLVAARIAVGTARRARHAQPRRPRLPSPELLPDGHDGPTNALRRFAASVPSPDAYLPAARSTAYEHSRHSLGGFVTYEGVEVRRPRQAAPAPDPTPSRASPAPRTPTTREQLDNQRFAVYYAWRKLSLFWAGSSLAGAAWYARALIHDACGRGQGCAHRIGGGARVGVLAGGGRRVSGRSAPRLIRRAHQKCSAGQSPQERAKTAPGDGGSSGAARAAQANRSASSGAAAAGRIAGQGAVTAPRLR
ncbi:hypothetical protein DFJ74DRAFT_678847 [Hyaloraphidium curvatum]|nr:hypothetical protein DFJ74DRAFT_678847 [Hyaloraphidium curvatum]